MADTSTPFPQQPLVVTAAATLGIVSFRSKILQQFKERWRLADEESHRRQELHHAHRNACRLGRPNDRTCRETWIKKWAGLGHDQISFEIFQRKPSRRGCGIQVGKRQPIRGVSQWSEWR